MNESTQPKEINNTIPSPVISQPPPSKLSPVLAVVLLLIVASGAGAYFMWMKPSQPVPPTTLQPTPTSVASPSANWKTYTNSKYGFAIDYPPAMKTQEELLYPPLECDESDNSPCIKEEDIFEMSIYYSSVDPSPSLRLKIIKKPQEKSIYDMAYLLSRGCKNLKETKVSEQLSGYVCTGKGQGIFTTYFWGPFKNKSTEMLGATWTSNLDTSNQILATFSFTDGSQSDSTADWKTYDGNGFGFKYPATWIVKYENGLGIVYNPETMFKGGNGGGVTMYTEHLYFKILPSTFTATAYVDTMEKSEKTDPADPLVKEFSRKKILLNNSETETYHRGGEGTIGWYVVFANGAQIIEIGPMDHEVTDNRIENQILATFKFE